MRFPVQNIRQRFVISYTPLSTQIELTGGLCIAQKELNPLSICKRSRASETAECLVKRQVELSAQDTNRAFAIWQARFIVQVTHLIQRLTAGSDSKLLIDSNFPLSVCHLEVQIYTRYEQSDLSTSKFSPLSICYLCRNPSTAIMRFARAAICRHTFN